MNDDYIDALNYAIKEEIADHYFHDRKVVDEELAELEEVRQEARAEADKILVLLADLAEVLMDEGHWSAFWNRAGLAAPPLDSLPGGGARVWHGERAGFGWKGRYKGLAKRTAERVAWQAAKYLQAHQVLEALVTEVNEDIVKFNQNHDFLMLRSVLCEMDPELVSKKHWLGTTLEGEACFDLGEAMMFRKQKLDKTRIWDLEESPEPRALAKAAAETAHLILREKAPEVRARMDGGA